MKQWFQNKKNIRSILIAALVLVSVGVGVSSIRITPASKKQTALAQQVEQNSVDEKSTKDSSSKNEDKKKNSADEIEKDKNENSAKSDKKQSDTEEQTDNSNSSNQKDNDNGDASEEKPSNPEKPVKPEQAQEISCTISITCDAISGNGLLTENGYPNLEPYAANPVIVGAMTVKLKEGDSVYEALQQACQTYGIAVDASNGYVRGINYLYEKNAGKNSGWMYSVNGVAPPIGCTSCKVREGDVIQWYYVTGLN